jgi:phytoene/squalene synthetase
MGLTNAQKATARGRSKKLKRCKAILALFENHLVEHQQFLKDFKMDWEREKKGSEEEQQVFLKKTFDALGETLEKGSEEVEKLLAELNIPPEKMAELEKAMAEDVEKAKKEKGE